MTIFIQAAENHIRFQHLTINDGLSQGLVYAILQDSHGFLWFGTKDGLNRYDGYHIKVFNHDIQQIKSLSNNTIQCLCEDNLGYIWVGTQRGLNRFNPAKEEFQWYLQRVDDENSLINNNVLCIDKDQAGCLWIGTANGLDCYDPVRETFTHYKPQANKPEGLKHGYVKAVYAETDAKIWVGTRDGLLLFNPQTGVFQMASVKNNGKIDPFNKNISRIFKDREGIIWCGTSRGLFFQSPDQSFFADRNMKGFADVTITGLYQDYRGKIWIVTFGEGVSILDKSTGQFQKCLMEPDNSNSVSSVYLHSVYGDHSGVVWLGTAGFGLDKWATDFNWFQYYGRDSQRARSLSFRSVRAIYSDRQGNLWIGGYGGLDKVDVKHNHYTHFGESRSNNKMLSSANVRSIGEDPFDPANIIWLGFEEGGLNKFDLQKGNCLKRFSNKDVTHRQEVTVIFEILTDKRGFLWLATENGLIRFDVIKETSERFSPVGGPLKIDGPLVVQTLRQGVQGNLLLGTQRRGLIYFDKATGSFASLSVNGQNPLDKKNVLCVYDDVKGNLWVGSNGSGLYHVNRNRKSYTHYTIREGLPNNVIYGIVEDKGGDLWISTNKGLSRFDSGKKIFKNYMVEDGLQSNEFNGGAYHKGSDGKIYFGGVNGVNVIQPQLIQTNPFKPNVVLTDFQIFNKSVSIGSDGYKDIVFNQAISRTKEITLSYKSNVFTFEFAALHYVSPEKNQYAYKIEGFEKEWNLVGNRRYATYTALPHGDYTFRVKASNNDGIWNEEGLSLKLKIIPPFWKTWWFRAFMVLLLITLAAIYYKIRTAQFRSRNIQLEENNLILNREIAERNKIEIALKESEKNYRTLFVSIPDPILIFHKENHRILDCNQAALNRYGYTLKELDQMTPFDLHAPVDESTGTIITNQPKQHLHLTRDNMQLQVEVHTTEVDYRGDPAYVAIIRDITLQKQLEQELIQAQKMESIGKLAGGIAHDFNNLLTAMLGHAELALMKMIKDSPLEKDIRSILNSGQRASSLISQLLAFGRKQLIKPVVLNVNDLIDDLQNMLRRLIGEDIEIVADMTPGILNIKADPVQVEQILINLIINARDAIREQGISRGEKRISIKTDQVFLDDRYAKGHLEVQSGEYVVINVSDTGIGMDENTRKQIFDPFFTTKGELEGTGLGMSTVYGIVKQNHGSIYVYSEPEKGTTIKIYWPTSAEKLEPSDGKILSTEAVAQFKSVLIVEDDKNVRDFTLAALQEMGYQVIACATGMEAIDLVQKDSVSFDLLITDLIMPEMNGRDLSEKMAAMFPQLKIIITSGYPDRHLSQLQNLPAGIQFLAKPYSIQSLVEIINLTSSK